MITHNDIQARLLQLYAQESRLINQMDINPESEEIANKLDAVSYRIESLEVINV